MTGYLHALLDLRTGRTGVYKSATEDAPVKIVRETNDAGEPFNCQHLLAAKTRR